MGVCIVLTDQACKFSTLVADWRECFDRRRYAQVEDASIEYDSVRGGGIIVALVCLFVRTGAGLRHAVRDENSYANDDSFRTWTSIISFFFFCISYLYTLRDE